jgi:aminoglycoside phosphotransferase (APT) family kinase protein
VLVRGGLLGNGRRKLSEQTHQSIDRTAPVRRGEELDVCRLVPYLEAHIPGLEGEVEVRQFPAGHSNLTYLVRFENRELVLRRPPTGRKPKSGHDMGREHRVLSALYGTFPYCPQPLLLCDDETIAGCPFHVMERLCGIVIRRDLPADLELSPAEVATLFERLIDVLVELHAVDYRQVGLADFGKPEGYVARQVHGWTNRYRRARTPDVPDFEPVMKWLADNMPPDGDRPSIIHNDFRLDNVVLDPNDPLRIIGVLDWEMATVGDPLMDLGSSLAYWVERDDPPEVQALRMMPSNVDGAPSRQRVVAMYAARSGLDVGAFDFYYCYGLFRVAVIMQQIYYRFYHAQTQDRRFAAFRDGVATLESTVRKVMEGGGI